MKSTFKASRFNGFSFDPFDLNLVTDPSDPIYDPRVNLPLDESLVKSIMFQGVIEPVVITKREGKPYVVAGRQRVRASREANIRLKEMGKEEIKVPCVVRRGDDSSMLGVSISENENRQDDSPLGRAEKCSRYLEMGRNEEEAAIVFGVTKHCVSAWMRLLECSTPVKNAVRDGKIAASAASNLADLPLAKQKETLNTLIEESKKNGKKVTARRVAKATGKASARNKSRKEINKKLEDEGLSKDYRSALTWVLGI